jgi:hypothetical protein
LPPVVTLTSDVACAARSRTKMLLDPKGVYADEPDEPAGGLPVKSVAESLKATSLPSGLKAYELMKLFESLPSGVTLTRVVFLESRLVR